MATVVFVTQEVDPAHPALAATVSKIAALAERFEQVAVLAGGAVPGVLPANCRVRTFRAGTKVGRGLRFEAALGAELAARPRPAGVLAHMCPIYAVLAAPLARPLRVPVLLWYTHWHADRMLSAATRASNVILSVDTRSFPLASPKVRAIGHGIDVEEFRCAERDSARAHELRAVSLGRYSPAKGLEIVLRAVRLAADRGVHLRLEVLGPTLSELERAHRAELERLVAELDLTGRASLRGAIPRADVPALLAGVDVLVNNMRAGTPDKAVYEAAATCLPVLASNAVFDSLLPAPLRFDRDRPDELADRLAALAALDPAARSALGRELRARVVADHSVGSWAAKVHEAVTS
jgi:glycosyltransferase involved in cell wall biosynthesis